MAYLELPFGVRVSGSDPIDGDRYLAQTIAQRNLLVTNGRALESQQCYVVADQTLYVLKGNTNADWEPVGSGQGGNGIPEPSTVGDWIRHWDGTVGSWIPASSGGGGVSPATQTEVNQGTVGDKYISPVTLAGSALQGNLNSVIHRTQGISYTPAVPGSADTNLQTAHIGISVPVRMEGVQVVPTSPTDRAKELATFGTVGTMITQALTIGAYLPIAGGTATGPIIGRTQTGSPNPSLDTNEFITKSYLESFGYRAYKDKGTAGESLATGDVVMEHLDGKLYKVKSTDAIVEGGTFFYVYIGGAADAEIDIVTALSMPCTSSETSSCTSTIGTLLYLSETAGKYTTVIPTNGFIRLIGRIAPDKNNWFPQDRFVHLEADYTVISQDGKINGVPIGGSGSGLQKVEDDGSPKLGGYLQVGEKGFLGMQTQVLRMNEAHDSYSNEFQFKMKGGDITFDSYTDPSFDDHVDILFQPKGSSSPIGNLRATNRGGVSNLETIGFKKTFLTGLTTAVIIDRTRVINSTISIGATTKNIWLISERSDTTEVEIILPPSGLEDGEWSRVTRKGTSLVKFRSSGTIHSTGSLYVNQGGTVKATFLDGEWYLQEDIIDEPIGADGDYVRKKVGNVYSWESASYSGGTIPEPSTVGEFVRKITTVGQPGTWVAQSGSGSGDPDQTLSFNTTDNRLTLTKQGTNDIVDLNSLAGGMTDAQVKTAYENNTNTNAFTDTYKASIHSHSNKNILDGIATANLLTAVERAAMPTTNPPTSSNKFATMHDIPAAGGNGDVTADANLGDNLLIRGNGSTKGIQKSGITVSDANELINVSGINTSTKLQRGGQNAIVNETSGSSTTILKVWTGTQAEYAAITTKDSQTIYHVT